MAKPQQNQIFAREFARLNPAQRQAVENIEGPLLVVAGPGTGKTQVVALRIAQILNKTQLSPRNILALTFTEAGVTALRQRLERIIGPDAYQVTVATFHGFANEVVATFPYVFGFAVEAMQVTELERLQIIHQIVEQNTGSTALRPVRTPTFHVPSIGEAIRKCKQENVSPDDLVKHSEDQYDVTVKQAKKLTELQRQAAERTHYLNKELAKIYESYQKILKARNLYDYEDMILFALQGLRQETDVRAYYQERYQYFLVDEYQDTNNAQNSLVEALAEFFANPNLCVVGDDKQAIYRFQGASVSNMLHFVKKYPQLKIVSLVENYRSAEPILAAASDLIRNNKHQLTTYLPELEPKLSATRGSERCELKIVDATNLESQFSWIVEQIKSRQKKGINYQDMAVLLRKNDEVKAFREFAARSGLPIAGVETTNLLNEPDVQQVMTILQAVNDLTDEINVSTALSLIKPVSPITIARLARLLREGKTFKQSLTALELQAAEKKKAEEALQSLVEWSKKSKQLPLPELIEEIVCSSLLMEHISQSKNALERLELVKAFLNEARRFSVQNPQTRLEDFIAYIRLLRSYRVRLPVHRLGPKNEGVFVNTVHGAKGLEFDTVFLPNVSTKSWNDRGKRELIKLPSAIVGLKSWDEAPIEEERRLFYVALTRAKNCLYLSYAKYDEEGREVLPAQFVTEIREHFSVESYEPNANEAIKIVTTSITPSAPIFVRDQEKKVIRELISENPFSFTDYKTYKTCPKQYLLNCVLRFPTRPDPRLIYGDILHRALEMFYKQYRTRKSLPSLDALLNYGTLVARQSEAFKGKQAITAQTQKLLEAYYSHIQENSIPPVGVEYSFRSHHVLLDDIWLTGKFDRIDPLDATARTVRVVDYKTGSQAQTRGQIEGSTKSSDGKLKEQLVFYALLASLDRHFPYHATEFSLKFLDDKHTFREEIYRITESETSALAEDIKRTFEEILSTDIFEHTRDDFDQGCQLCEIFSQLA